MNRPSSSSRDRGHRGKIVNRSRKSQRHQGVRVLAAKKVSPILDPSASRCSCSACSRTSRNRANEKQQRLLADVNITLADSLDYEQTLATVTELAVRGPARLRHRRCDGGMGTSAVEGGQRRRRNAALCAALERMPAPSSSIRPIGAGEPPIIERVTGADHCTSGRLRLSAPRDHLAHRGAALDAGKPLGVLMFG